LLVKKKTNKKKVTRKNWPSYMRWSILFWALTFILGAIIIFAYNRLAVGADPQFPPSTLSGGWTLKGKEAGKSVTYANSKYNLKITNIGSSTACPSGTTAVSGFLGVMISGQIPQKFQNYNLAICQKDLNTSSKTATKIGAVTTKTASGKNVEYYITPASSGSTINLTDLAPLLNAIPDSLTADNFITNISKSGTTVPTGKTSSATTTTSTTTKNGNTNTTVPTTSTGTNTTTGSGSGPVATTTGTTSGATSTGGDLKNAVKVETGVQIPGSNQTAFNYCTYVNAIYKFAIKLGIMLVILMIVYAGYLYLFSQGDSTKINNAKDIIIGAILGYLLLLVIGVILNFIGLPASECVIR
jgi:hypothetical protein